MAWAGRACRKIKDKRYKIILVFIALRCHRFRHAEAAEGRRTLRVLCSLRSPHNLMLLWDGVRRNVIADWRRICDDVWNMKLPLGLPSDLMNNDELREREGNAEPEVGTLG